MTTKDWVTALAPLFSIVGVVVTVIVTRRTADRAHSVRWDQTRHSAYARYASAVKQEVRLHLMIAESRWPGMWPHHATVEPLDGLKRLNSAEDERSHAFEAMILLADPSTVTAARAWQQAVWELRQSFSPNYAGGGETFIELFNRTAEPRTEFYIAARRDLDVTGAIARTAPVQYGQSIRLPQPGPPQTANELG